MNLRTNRNEPREKMKKFSAFVRVCSALIFAALFLSACNQLDAPKSEPFYAQTTPPPIKEFRWSNGKMPKSFDPALAFAPPASDVVRAIYEGLTDLDPKILKPIPAIAADWKSSEDFKIWTFDLRKDARWSNGERISAKDFVRSWKRLAEMKERLAHPELLQNIVGLKVLHKEVFSSDGSEELTILPKPAATRDLPFLQNQTNSDSAIAPAKTPEKETIQETKKEAEKPAEPPFGVEAIDNFTLKVSLVNPDKDFPALVAHPIFRPIYGDGKEFESGKLDAGIVTSGAFRIFSIGQDGITLDRAENYWNREAVELERVRFIPIDNAEKALAAYRAGEIDAVTNINFEPLALKLLTPFEDFERAPHAALNYYEFKRGLPPFDDKRVREALAISIERERITEDEMDGASQPALSFLPFAADQNKLAQNIERAKKLLAETGFPNGENFPVVKLLVNRNNLQQRVARRVAQMWKQNLNIETEIVVKDADEIETAWSNEDFALVRRNVVFPTIDEESNMAVIFAAGDESLMPIADNKIEGANEIFRQNGNSNITSSVIPSPTPENLTETETGTSENADAEISVEKKTISTEHQAFEELNAIPLYFPTSYSLVKPYIKNFDINVLDAPSLKNVKIDNNWQPPAPKSES